MRYLYNAFLRPKQSRSATKWHVLTGSHNFYLLPDIAYYSIYRPLKDERLSWLNWLTYSGRLTHIGGHLSAAGRAWDRKVRRSKTNVLTTVPRNETKVIK